MKASDTDTISPKNSKIAIIHNSLWNLRGAERVLGTIAQAFPDAHIYLISGSSSIASKLNIDPSRIKYSSLAWLARTETAHKLLFPYWWRTVRNYDLSDYDVIISLSSSVCRGARANDSALHISYILTPFRPVWDLKELYLKSRLPLLRLVESFMFSYLRVKDVEASKQPDVNIPVSNYISHRLSKFNGIKADEVLYPPVDFKRLDKLMEANPDSKDGDYLLAIAPKQPNKRLDRVLELGRQLKKHDLKIKIIGMNRPFFRRYTPGVEFLGWVSEAEKTQLISGARYTLFLGSEDFGLAAIESLYLGTPIIGWRSTVAEELSQLCPSGVSTVSDVVSAVKVAKTLPLSFECNHDEFRIKFSSERFISRFQWYIDERKN